MNKKQIHYCWFGRGELPELAIRCINSWKKQMPDYEIIEWNEDNFDVRMIPYSSAAYDAKKYAFVSDYARFWVLYHYGGIYLDTDVELLQPLDDIISQGPFLGCERDGVNEHTNFIAVNPGVGMYAEAKMPFYENLLAKYKQMEFNTDVSKIPTIVDHTTNALLEHGLVKTDQIQNVCGINVYPKEYFCPKSIITGETKITRNSYSIHHFNGSWQTGMQKLKLGVWFVLRRMKDLISKLKPR